MKNFLNNKSKSFWIILMMSLLVLPAIIMYINSPLKINSPIPIEQKLKAQKPIVSLAKSSVTPSALSSQKEISLHPLISIQSWKTSNKVPVFYVKNETLPLIHIQLSFKGGSAADELKKGSSYLLSQMLSEGTLSLSENEFAEQTENLGINLFAKTTKDKIYIHLLSLTDSEYLSPALNLMTDMIYHPAFKPENLDKVKMQILSRLENEAQLPRKLIKNAVYKNLYGDHPYAYPIKGSKESINQLTIEDLKSQHEKLFNAQNALISIVGNVNKEKAEAIAEQISKDLNKTQEAFVLKAFNHPSTTQDIEHIAFDSTQAHLALSALALTPENPNYYALLVGNHILGGGGFSSRLVKGIRIEGGLAYTVNSHFHFLKDSVYFGINLQTQSNQAQVALEKVKSIYQEFLDNGPTDTELAKAKDAILGGFPLTFGSNAQMDQKINFLSFYNLPLDYYDHYRANIDKVSMADIKAAFNKYLSLDKLQIIIVGKNAS
ncbi:MAG: peptidase family protein [Francisellaceae bacterium]|nr:peptidase family protein [Francisellaceae bacterium]